MCHARKSWFVYINTDTYLHMSTGNIHVYWKWLKKKAIYLPHSFIYEMSYEFKMRWRDTILWNSLALLLRLQLIFKQLIVVAAKGSQINRNTIVFICECRENYLWIQRKLFKQTFWKQLSFALNLTLLYRFTPYYFSHLMDCRNVLTTSNLGKEEKQHLERAAFLTQV